MLAADGMMSDSLVSVIIPVYNGKNYLAEAVESVRAQTYPRIELIVVDDGSTDDTWQLIQSFGDSVRGIRKDNGGVASALNRGIEAAHGHSIAWLSHDDLFLPHKLERQVKFLEGSTEAGACYTDFRVIDSGGAVLRDMATPSLGRNELRRHLFGRMFINGSTMLIRRRCFDEIGMFREELRTTQDAEMWLRLLDRWDIGRVPEVLGLQRTHPEQGSRVETSHELEKMTMFSAAFDRLGVVGLFPELSGDPDSPRALSYSHIWLADTMAVHRYWFEFADQHYRAAVEIWPSLRNPARPRRLLGARRWTAPSRRCRLARHQLGLLRRRIGPSTKVP